MADKVGRTELLDAATQIRRMRASLEAERAKADAQIKVFSSAEDVLKILAEADRTLVDFEAKISAAEKRLSAIDAKVLETEAASKKTIEGFLEQVKKGRAEADATLAEIATEQKANKMRLGELKASSKAAEKEASEKIEDLNRQIAEKEASLASLRDTISKLASL